MRQDVVKMHFSLNRSAIEKEIARWSREDPTFLRCPTAQQTYAYPAYGRYGRQPAPTGATIDLVAAVSSKLATLRS